MKKSLLVISVIFCLVFISIACKKHSIKPQDQLSLLPAATQTGANTLGCLINGQAFVPQNRSILEGPALQCNYIYLSGGYYFTLHVANKNSDNSVTAVNVSTDSLAIIDGQNFALKSYSPGNAQGSYVLYYNTGGDNAYQTNDINGGQLTITKLDTLKQIASGIFHFNAVNNKGDTVKITNGRFDMPYTR